MMNREDIFAAMRKAATNEFAEIPAEKEIEYEFSEKFNLKMEKLLNKVEYNSKHILSRAKRNFVALTAAIIILLAGLLSVSAVRESLLEFLVNVQDTFAEFTFGGETTKQIDYVYSLSEIPEGFVLTEQRVDFDMCVTRYENPSTNESISFRQIISDGTDTSVDRETGEYEKIWFGNTEVYLYKSNIENISFALWVQNGYYMELVFRGKNSSERIVELLNTIS